MDLPPEHVFLAESGVEITQTRAVFRTQTFAVANIASYRLAAQQPALGFGIVLLIAGLCVLIPALTDLAGGQAANPGRAVLMLLSGIAVMALAGFLCIQTQYVIWLRDGTYSRRVLITGSRDFASRIIAALDAAVAARG